MSSITYWIIILYHGISSKNIASALSHKRRENCRANKIEHRCNNFGKSRKAEREHLSLNAKIKLSKRWEKMYQTMEVESLQILLDKHHD